MREILFRAKVKSKEELIGKGFPIDSKGEPVTEWVFGVPISRYPDLFLAWNEACNEYEEINIVPETITEYTGLKDKNGVRIFEHDILKFGDRLFMTWWNDESFQWQAGLCIDDEWDNVSLAEIAAEIPILGKMSTEIVGNIFDNPELLKFTKYTKENLLFPPKPKAESWFRHKSMIYCPKCASSFDAAMMSDYNYCPNCGVKLNKE